jgi:23S rRNA pseudouridine1911/1915/1917 synthase
LQKNQKQNKSYVTKTDGGKHAVLEYKQIKKLDNFYHLEIKPKTGRHHQIRVQLAHIGCIIKGDLKYGAKRSNKDASIHLLAQKLEFIHPVKKEPVSITSPAPKDSVWEACK